MEAGIQGSVNAEAHDAMSHPTTLPTIASRAASTASCRSRSNRDAPSAIRTSSSV